MTKNDYDDIIQLLPLMIIVYSKNYTILIIIKENIIVNRQNRLIAHPYSMAIDIYSSYSSTKT